MKPEPPPRLWPGEIYDTLKSVGVRQVAFVPDAGHTQLISSCHADPDMKAVSLTTEEEGIAMLSGAWLGGDRGVLLMQSSGVGNCINMLSIVTHCRIPLLMLVTMRGEWGEFNPWQLHMGQSTPKVLEAAGVFVQRADAADEVAQVTYAAAQLAFSSNTPVAVLLSQRLLGFKDWSK
ncbi:thiamine pyrophosphate-binding protein [Aquabacter spiritensis]|uniref:Sulfopyruvate decarboxylase alpha subunit n=1 Tax=Aquabacter spiritensis TaxID=933073 RepID=A0A4R3M4I5_9HYPH|nr:thiamine pyrophosphate-binding protein [Aquabacter spiritensis]TCT07493.1 sulfopyruvate decarboxylase alpha subunit [Aquabacter spiritensis]